MQSFKSELLFITRYRIVFIQVYDYGSGINEFTSDRLSNSAPIGGDRLPEATDFRLFDWNAVTHEVTTRRTDICEIIKAPRLDPLTFDLWDIAKHHQN